MKPAVRQVVRPVVQQLARPAARVAPPVSQTARLAQPAPIAALRLPARTRVFSIPKEKLLELSPPWAWWWWGFLRGFSTAAAAFLAETTTSRLTKKTSGPATTIRPPTRKG